MVESIYNGLNLIFTWFALANFYIFFVSQSRQPLFNLILNRQVILTSALEGAAFNIPHINILNTLAQACHPAQPRVSCATLFAEAVTVWVSGCASRLLHLWNGKPATGVSSRSLPRRRVPRLINHSSPWKYKITIYFFAILTT